MSNSESTAMPDSPQPLPGAHADGAPVSGTAALPWTRLLYWSVLRELWEARWIFIVPLIIVGVVLLGFVTGLVRVPLPLRGDIKLSALPPQMSRVLEAPFEVASAVLMGTYFIVALIYCLGTLHGERWDRSILFWKSLPVSDTTTVIAKASIPIVLLPLISFAVTVFTHLVMLLAGSAVLFVRGIHVAGIWAQIPFLSMWAALLYHIVTVHALYYAPIYGWPLLVSGWARRAAFLWAALPIVAIIILEKLVFDTSVFAHMLRVRLTGGPAADSFTSHGNLNMHVPAASFASHGGMMLQTPTLANFTVFLTSPGLWIGLAVFALFLLAAIWQRRRQGPI